MSKDLEREYRALVDSEVPDLWARIEAGLEEKKTAPEKAETDLHITDFPAADSQMENMRDRRVNFKVWAGVAAACVCVVLIVPAVARTMIMGGNSSSYSNSASDDLSQDSAPQAGEAFFENSAESVRQEAADEDGVNNAAAPDVDGAGNIAVSDRENTSSDANASNVITSGGLEETAGAEQEPNIFHVTVEITDIDVSMDSNVLYTATVIASENTDMRADSQIKIIGSAVTAEDAAMLEKSQTYDLMLCEEHSDDSGQESLYILVNDAAE